MAYLKDEPLNVRAHRNATGHGAEIRRSSICGRFYCLTVFEPPRILDWVDEGETSLCPNCGIDAVIGNASGFSLTHELLERMRRHWF